MRAVVVERPGGPEVLHLREVPKPVARPGWALVRVKAFGLNRSELVTRQGGSPSVRFPRILGIECVGVVEEVRRPGVEPGTAVAAAMGGMGRAYDGSYAECVLVPEERLMPLRSSLPWDVLGALPETFLTARGALETLGAAPGQTLLVRGATSSVGLAALALARAMGLRVAGTTRSEAKGERLRARGAEVLLDRGQELAGAVRELFPPGVDLVLDLVGGPALVDLLRALAPGGTACHAGALSGAWSIPDFAPLSAIPSGARLTVYSSETLTADWGAPRLQEVADRVAEGAYDANVERVFALEEIVEAHRHMEESRGAGKLVVTP
jgi:NADPH:quinone reductase-like Zn-dependent oxidoreductase